MLGGILSVYEIFLEQCKVRLMLRIGSRDPARMGVESMQVQSWRIRQVMSGEIVQNDCPVKYCVEMIFMDTVRWGDTNECRCL